ncbi:MAG: DUF167 domain-containing protein [Candidatus Omnitrophota bacterium]
MRRIELKVITKAKREGIEKIADDRYRIKVLAPPENGKANKRVIELLSEKFGIKKGKIRIVSGEKSCKKIVELQ